MNSGHKTLSGPLAGLVITFAVLWAGCKPPTAIPLPDAGDQGPCPSGYLFVAAGTFEMGINPDDPLYGNNISLFWDLMPRRTVMLSDYCIQKTEATVDSFKSCVKAGKCPGLFQQRSWHESCNYSEELDDRDNHPMNCVSWAAAREYCQQWAGGDLPSDAQWEKAARGTDRRLFPWGNEPLSCDRANWDEDGPYNSEGGGQNLGCMSRTFPATWPVGTLDHQGDSPYGLKDMSGNVSEWVLDCFDSDLRDTCSENSCVDPVDSCDAGPYATRGGSAENDKIRLFTVMAHGQSDQLQTDVGFRCVLIPAGRRNFAAIGR